MLVPGKDSFGMTMTNVLKGLSLCDMAYVVIHCPMMDIHTKSHTVSIFQTHSYSIYQNVEPTSTSNELLVTVFFLRARS